MAEAGPHVVFLIDARDRREAGWLQDWLDEGAWRQGVPPEAGETPPVWQARRLGREPVLPDEGAVWLVPVRMVWLPSDRRGVGGLWEDLTHGRVIAPGPLRRLWIRRYRPHRMRPVMGEGAWLESLREAYDAHPSTFGRGTFGGFVRTRAQLALEIAERMQRGPRYRFPRLLPADLFAGRHYAQRLEEIAGETDETAAAVHDRARRYMDEMAASQTPFMLDLIIALYRAGVRARHDGGIVVDPEQIDRLARRLRGEPVIFVISHKSMLDTVAFSLMLYDAGLPIPLTFGGINLRTPGVGWLAKRAGIIFLRRQFQDNPVYKATFRRYIDYLIGRRFSLMWALEGTRSRSGKLLAPRFGMFRYVIDALHAHHADKLRFVPVSVVYDQITEVRDYAAEQQGDRKKPEGMTWMVRFLRRGTPRGRILIRLGEGVTLAGLDGAREPEQDPVPSLAFAVAEQMNSVTPITPIAIICLILLAAGDRALTWRELSRLVRAARAAIRRRGLELVDDAHLREPAVLRSHVHRLLETRVLIEHDDGLEPQFSIREGHHHEAAYYRNTAIHYFVMDAVVEISLLRALSDEAQQRRAVFESTASDIRHLLRLEFYFPRRSRFSEALESSALRRFGSLETLLAQDADTVRARVLRSVPVVGHGVFRSFVDAYAVVIDEWLGRDTPPTEGDRAAFVDHCLKSGRQRLRERRVFAAESVSKVLYETAFDWALAESARPADTNMLTRAPALLGDLDHALRTLRAAGDSPRGRAGP
jgi:glycerol-3-phosphate O-acyltransferase